MSVGVSQLISLHFCRHNLSSYLCDPSFVVAHAEQRSLHGSRHPMTSAPCLSRCSVYKEKNEVRWSPVLLETLLDVNAIIEYWQPRGMVLHRTPSLRPFPDLTQPEVAFPQYPLGSLDPNLVVRCVAGAVLEMPGVREGFNHHIQQQCMDADWC